MTVIHCGPPPLTANPDLILDPSSPTRGVILDVTGVEATADAALDPLVHDLLAVGSYVFLADGAVARTRRRDPLARGWRRELELRIPVSDPDRWTAAAPALSAALEFATDDGWTFGFRERAPDPQLTLDLVVPPAEPSPTCVCLFSGGLDSLAGALRLADETERPILASHWTTSSGRAFKDDVLAGLRNARPDWRFPNATLHTVRGPGLGDAKDSTQRSRGVLYLNLAAAIALQSSLTRIVVPENGVTSLNLSQSAQSVGAMRSRTTHPKALMLQRAFFRALGVGTTVDAPFAEMTKADVIREAVQRGGEPLAHLTVSCAHGMFRRKLQPHCGTCSQCVDRRLAGIAAGWGDELERQQHQVDLLRDPLPEGDAAMYAEQYLRFSQDVLDMTIDDLAQQKEVWAAAQARSADGRRELFRIYDLVRRHAEQIDAVYRQIWSNGAADYLRGRVPRDSLLGRIGQLEHRREPWQRLADRIAELVAPALRKAFAGAPPVREADVQREIDVAVTAARANLVREFPTVSYGPIGTRPDFSSTTSADELDEPALFVEVKLARRRSDVRDITDEIHADIPKYAARARSALFLVYDGGGFIVDEQSFADLFECRGPVRVHVLRQ